MDALQLVTLIQSIPGIGQFIVWLPVMVLLCTAIDVAFPQPAAGSPWVPLRRITSWLAGSFLNAKNAVPAGAPPAAIALAAAAEAVVAKAVMPVVLLLLAGVTLAGCVAPPPAAGPGLVTPAPGKAALFCGIVTAYGPLTVALISAADPLNAPVAVTTKAAVDAACALAGGVAVSPPPAGVVAPRVAVPGPVEVVAP